MPDAPSLGPRAPGCDRPGIQGPGACHLQPVDWADLAGFADDDHRDALLAFQALGRARAHGSEPTRPGLAPSPALVALLHRSLALDTTRARDFFECGFRAWRVVPPSGDGFLTGYYEPEVDGALAPGPGFAAPLLARPDDLVTFAPGETLFDPASGFDPTLSAARRLSDGRLVPYPDRAAIQNGAIDARPLVWLRDLVEVFLIQVQGSARVRLPDGQVLRLGYAGRNGRPYTSIGRLLVTQGHMNIGDMSLARLKAWLRENPELGGDIMRRNQSYVFFKLEERLDPRQGPIGAAGVPLTPLRSIAVDRNLWPYGLPFWIEAQLPWHSALIEPFRRLMLAQDTGSAILGPVRADVFFGAGEANGVRAGDIRHAAAFTVLLPVGEDPAAGGAAA